MLIPVFTTVLVQAAGGKSLGTLMAMASLPGVLARDRTAARLGRGLRFASILSRAKSR